MATKKKGLWIRGTYFDYPAFFLLTFLALFGLMMVYSSSTFVARRDMGDSAYYLKRQMLWTALGAGAAYLVSHVRYQWFKKMAQPLMILEFVLLLLVFVVGSSANGSTRWIYIGPIGFQPSELAKIVLAIYMSKVCTDHNNMLKTIGGTIRAFIQPIAMVGLIVIENLSTGIVCAVIVGGIWFVSTPKPKFVFGVVILGLVGIVLLINAQGYRSDRITAWRNPEGSDKGYQILQALYAIGSGGFFGKGLGQSIQKSGYIPFAHNDMIFSVICEELGIVGAAGLIIVFIMLLWRFKFIAEGAPDRFGSLYVVGIITHIAFQSLVNMSVNTNVIPNTGVPLPFISYGGTSLIFLLIEVGIVLGISRQIVPAGKEQYIQ